MTVAGIALLTLLSLLWLALNRAQPWGPPILGWIPPVLSFALVTWELLGLGRSPGLAASARRFWTAIGVSSLISMAGVAIQAFVALTSPGSGSQGLPRPTILLFVLAAVCLLWGLLRLPVGTRSRAEWFRLTLDAATVMAASGLFVWMFAFRPLFERRPDALILWGLLGAVVLCQVAVAAMVKVLLAGAGPLDPGALRYLGLSMCMGSGVASVTSLLADHSDVAPSQVAICPLALAGALAVARQRRVMSAGRAGAAAGRRRRPYSLLPYVAVAATQVLLITKVSDAAVRPIVVGGAVTVTGLVVVRQWAAFADISRLLGTLKDHEERLRHQASHDALTGLANRTLFGQRLDDALADRRAGDPAILLIDLDDFKTVNDTLGHAVGDTLLTVIADRLRECVRSGDLVARLGGDEFAVLLVHVTPDEGTRIAERILRGLSEPVQVDGHLLRAGASMGLAVPDREDDAGCVLRNADVAMYQAKKSGKGSLVWYTPSPDAPGRPVPALR